MPFGKTSQTPVPKPFMAKIHVGLGNHKVVMKSHAHVHGNAGLKPAVTGQPGQTPSKGKTSGTAM